MMSTVVVLIVEVLLLFIEVPVVVAVSKILCSASNSSTNEGYLLTSHHSQIVSIVSYTEGIVSSLSGTIYPHKVSCICDRHYRHRHHQHHQQ